MEPSILQQIRDFPGRAGLYCQDLSTGKEWSVRGEEAFEAAGGGILHHRGGG